MTDDDAAVTVLAGSRSSGYVDGISSMAEFNGPRGLAFDASGGNSLLVSDSDRIRMIGLPPPLTSAVDSYRLVSLLKLVSLHMIIYNIAHSLRYCHNTLC